ncbi:hypothetical protein F5887DRAFT_1158416 [Amanita rubescens]|nr:hypothetical protein F5887DRAFT_1158416 [Amanita rubescens]
MAEKGQGSRSGGMRRIRRLEISASSSFLDIGVLLELLPSLESISIKSGRLSHNSIKELSSGKLGPRLCNIYLDLLHDSDQILSMVESRYQNATQPPDVVVARTVNDNISAIACFRHAEMNRVFIGAPSKEFLLSNNSESATFHWRTISPPSATASGAGTGDSFFIPQDAYEAASIRISKFYQNTIFHEESDNHDETTAYTWPPTLAQGNHDTGSRVDATVPSFLLHDSCTLESEPIPGGEETQISSPSASQSLSYSRSNLDLSRSIAHFPSFHFNPNSLSSLSLLSQTTRKVNLLLAVLEVDGPDTIKIKNGRDAGKEVAILKMIVGDEEGKVGKLTAWREVAEMWGGSLEGSVAVKRGDVILLEDVNSLRDAQTSPSLTASPYLGSRLSICYRTLPRENDDQRLRPDLRLGASDAAVRKVANVVRWFEKMAGLM